MDVLLSLIFENWVTPLDFNANLKGQEAVTDSVSPAMGAFLLKGYSQNLLIFLNKMA